MHRAEVVLEALYRDRVLVIHRGKDRESVLRKARQVRDGGIAIQEITWTTPDAGGILRELSKQKLGVLGAGSVLDVSTARAAYAAGAEFLVSPVYTKPVHDFCKRHKLLYVPGAATPQELYAAHQAGIRPVKVFPILDLGGAGYVKRVLAPMPFLELLPTAVGLAELPSLLQAGARAVGLGVSFTEEADLSAASSCALELAKGAA